MTAVKNEKMNRVTVHLDEKPIYDIVMTEDFSALPGEIEKLSISNRRLCIVTDSNVEKLYLNEVKELLAPCCKTVISFVFPAGEEHKNLDTVRDLYETLILNHFDRNDMLAALGGGVVGDLCALAGRRALILTRTKIWLARFICRSWYLPISIRFRRFRTTSFPPVWARLSNMV